MQPDREDRYRSYEEMLEAAGGFKDGEEPEKILCGGPMMGFAMPWLVRSSK